MAEEGFQCRAINDYYAGVTDELDLQAGQLYTIMQTSPSGWWYAYNEDGEDGWVPSNYLERIDEAGGGGGYDDAYDYAQDDGKEDKPVESSGGGASSGAGAGSSSATQAAAAQPTPAASQPASQPVAQTYDIPSSSGATAAGGPGDKPITEWTVDETVEFLKTGADAGDDFKLTQACRYLTQLATQAENCARILSLGGLDVVFDVMRKKTDDVAIQMSCCAAVVVLCVNPASKSFPAQLNGAQFISNALKQHTTYRPFVILAFNAVCNFCHEHPYHRDMVLQTDLLDLVVDGMDRFRGDKEGHRVQIAGCLALRNVAADPKGQAIVGRRGVQAVLEGVKAFQNTLEVVESGMGVLCNLCALQANGEAFVMSDGLRLLDGLMSDPNTPENVRLAAASVLHNLAANPDTALLLSAEEGIALIMKIVKKSPVDSLLFLNTLKVLAALLFKLPQDKGPGGTRKVEVMHSILERGIAAKLIEAVQFDNKELQEVAATVMVVIAQTDAEVAAALAQLDVASHLIQPCLNDPTPQMLHCTFAVFYHCTKTLAQQRQLAERGFWDVILSDWYTRPTTRPDTFVLATALLFKMVNENFAQDVIAREGELRALVPHLIEHDKQSLASNLETQINNLVGAGGGSSAPTTVQYTEYKQAPAEPAAQAVPAEPAATQAATAERTSRVQMPETLEAHTAAPEHVDGGRTHAEEPSSPNQEITNFYPYDVLKSGCPAGVDATRKEGYLSDADFEEVFGMPKERFYAQRSWKQKQLKKNAGLF